MKVWYIAIVDEDEAMGGNAPAVAAALEDVLEAHFEHTRLTATFEVGGPPSYEEEDAFRKESVDTDA